MRLVCPNCDAKYEVPEDAIPETGRDVQCANCGHAWFQMRPRAAVAETVSPAQVTAPAPVPEPAPAPEPAPFMETAVATPPAPEPVEAPVETAVETSAEPATPDPVDEAEAEAAPVVEVPAPRVDAPVEAEVTPVVAEAEAEAEIPAAPVAAAAAVGAAAYAVDDSVLAILREEAERETLARRAEVAKPLEIQPDLGIDAALPSASKPAASPVAADPAAEDERHAARRALLPDVEEINSTLRPSEAAEPGPGETVVPVVEGRSSFRSGFLLVVTAAILGSAIYGSADALADAVPALAGPLKAYVGFVDSLRLQLDGLMQSATVAINGD